VPRLERPHGYRPAWFERANQVAVRGARCSSTERLSERLCDGIVRHLLVTAECDQGAPELRRLPSIGRSIGSLASLTSTGSSCTT
jgi:hypothetical protein